MLNTSTYTASEARKNLYTLLKKASRGVKAYEIILRGGAGSVVLINKAELEAWQETLDVLLSKEEIKAIKKGKKEKTISHKDFLKEIGLEDAN